MKLKVSIGMLSQERNAALICTRPALFFGFSVDEIGKPDHSFHPRSLIAQD